MSWASTGPHARLRDDIRAAGLTSVVVALVPHGEDGGIEDWHPLVVAANAIGDGPRHPSGHEGDRIANAVADLWPDLPQRITVYPGLTAEAVVSVPCQPCGGFGWVLDHSFADVTCFDCSGQGEAWVRRLVTAAGGAA